VVGGRWVVLWCSVLLVGQLRGSAVAGNRTSTGWGMHLAQRETNLLVGSWMEVFCRRVIYSSFLFFEITVSNET